MAYDIGRRTIAQLAAYIDDIIFPCSRKELLECAEDNQAPDMILDAIENLLDCRYFGIKDILDIMENEAARATSAISPVPARSQAPSLPSFAAQ